MNNGRTPERIRDIASRKIPVANLNITATTSGAAQTLITAPSAAILEITNLTVTNKSGTAATLTLHSVPDGGAIGDTNKELDAYNVPANTALNITGLIGGLYAAGTTIEVYSGTNGALVIRAAAQAHL